MYYYTGSYPKNGRRPYIRALNVNIFRYFFSIAAMSEYLGVSRQALKKRIDKMPVFGFPAYIKKNRRFEGRRVVRRKIIYYE
jgi:biotin operon repressor